MTKKIWKLFANYEKEENWLNEMSKNGYHFIKYTLFRYTFDYNPEETYTYRIELLNKATSDEKSLDYLSFLEDTGVKHVDTYFRWVYLRKSAKEGNFDLFTDFASKIKHHKGILYLQAPFGLLNLYFGFYNLMIGTQLSRFNLYISPISFAIGILLSTLAFKTYKRIKQLEKEQSIRES